MTGIGAQRKQVTLPTAFRSPPENVIRARSARERRRAAEIDAADRVEIVLQAVPCHGLDDHPRAVRLQRLPHMRRRAGWIADVVQAIDGERAARFGGIFGTFEPMLALSCVE